jgi:Leucine-rich repeat (LRR) protein
MENNQTIYYGEDKTTITNINHLRDIEISILNYMLINVENWIEITSKLNIEHFTFAANRRIFHTLYNMEISQKTLEIIKKKYKYWVLNGNKEQYIDLNYASASFILDSKASNNIELDLFELEEYYKAKNEVFQNDEGIFFTVKINSPIGDTTATFKDNRLIDIVTSNLKDLPQEIKDTFKSSLDNLMSNFNKEDTLLNLSIDEETELPNGFLLKKEIKKLEKIDKFKDWVKQNHLENLFVFNMSFNLMILPILEIENKNIKSLPNEIDILEELLILNLKDNDLTTLPNELMNIKHLIILILCDNKIEQIPEFIYNNMKQLSTICLHGNGLLYIEEDIGNLENLKTLTLSKNKIKTLPKNISKLSKLEDLAIENNPDLENIDKDILKLPNLKEFCVDDRFLPFIVSNKNLFSKIKYINLKYSNYKLNDELINQLDFEITDNDWQEENKDKYFGAIYLSTNEIADDSYDLEDNNE